MKIMNTKYFLLVDVETANMVEEALTYDIGFAVVDRKGKIYESHSLMLRELFFEDKELMKSAYYAEKIPTYLESYKRGERKVSNIWEARKLVKETMEKYGITEVFAYNASFDRDALNRSIRYFTESRVRYFFPYGTKIGCIWEMATKSICNSRNYVEFCLANGFFTPTGNMMTSAETVYRYLTNDVNFVEQHMGFEDVEIEAFIFAECLKRNRKVSNKVNRGCWQATKKTAVKYAPEPDNHIGCIIGESLAKAGYKVSYNDGKVSVCVDGILHKLEV